MRIETILNGGPNAAVANDISFATARRWLARLGWVWGRDRKGYVDGYERGDAVEYREKVGATSSIISLPVVWGRELSLQDCGLNSGLGRSSYLAGCQSDRHFESGWMTKPRPPWGTRQRIPVTHDESTFDANDDATHSWKKKGTQHLKKGKGKGLIVSEFLSAACHILTVQRRKGYMLQRY